LAALKLMLFLKQHQLRIRVHAQQIRAKITIRSDVPFDNLSAMELMAAASCSLSFG
jgi:hypothetical protein